MKIITVSHQKGGVGKSTLSLNLSGCFSHGLKVALCDTDLQGSLLSLSYMVDGLNIIKMPEEIQSIKNLPYDLIIIDTPPYLSNMLPDIFKISDFILVPTKAGFFDLMAIRSTLGIIEASIKENSNIKAGIVFNMIKGNRA